VTTTLTPTELGATSTTIGLRYTLTHETSVGIATIAESKDETKLTVLTPSDSVALTRTEQVNPVLN
jgi:hypothetical protein